MIRLVGKKLTNPNRLEPIKGIEEIVSISDKSKLPYWWVESVVVEYLPCRRFVQHDKVSVFNFEKITDSQIDSIKQCQVIMPGGSRLIQNISPEDFSFRSPKLMVGEYAEPLDQATLIPEGLANANAWLFQANSLLVADPKVGFNEYAVVRDNDLFYQYKIAELFDISSDHSWFKSELFDLIPLWNVMMQIHECQNELNKRDHLMIKSNLVKRITRLYDSLEQIRKPIREEAIRYHSNKKGSHDTTEFITADAPLIVFNESVKPVGNGFEVISYLEPLFYHSAYSNYANALEAKENQKNPDLKHESFQSEIEYSAVTIICSVTCLESYINGIIRKYLPNDLQIIDMSHEKKWINVLTRMNHTIKIGKLDEPIKSFVRLIGLRDKAVHYKPQYRKTVSNVSDGNSNVSYTYFNYNYQNAKFAIDVIHKMICFLSEKCNLPTPKWLKVTSNHPGLI